MELQRVTAQIQAILLTQATKHQILLFKARQEKEDALLAEDAKSAQDFA